MSMLLSLLRILRTSVRSRAALLASLATKILGRSQTDETT